MAETIASRDPVVDTDPHWTSLRPKWYKKKLPMWETAWVHYEADFTVLRSSKYLIQRIQGESKAQFDERLLTSDYMPLFGTAVDSLVGRLMAVELVDRRFSKEGSTRGLGRYDDPDTIAGRLWKDIDGKGTNYLTMIEDLAIRTTVLNEMWVHVSGIDRDENGNQINDATIKLIEPAAIVNVIEDKRGNPIEVLVEAEEDGRETLRDPFSETVVYTRFTLDGTQRVEITKDEGGNEEIEEFELNPYSLKNFKYYKTKKRRAKQLPIFKAELPLRRFVGHILACKNGVIFNQESERDNILRIACTPMFVFVGTDKAFTNAQKSRKKGDNAMQLDPTASNKHYYASPSTEPAELRTKVLRDKMADFFVSAFRFYEDSIRGKQKTATEIGQDAASGEGSFLNTLATMMDEAENNIMWRLEQIYFPNDARVWGQARVARPRDFQVISAREEADKLAELLFGKHPIPIGDTGRLNAIRQIATAHKVEFVEVEAKGEIKKAHELPEVGEEEQGAGEVPATEPGEATEGQIEPEE